MSVTAVGAGMNSGRLAALRNLFPNEPHIVRSTTTKFAFSEASLNDGDIIFSGKVVEAGSDNLKPFFSYNTEGTGFFVYAVDEKGQLKLDIEIVGAPSSTKQYKMADAVLAQIRRLAEDDDMNYEFFKKNLLKLNRFSGDVEG